MDLAKLKILSKQMNHKLGENFHRSVTAITEDVKAIDSKINAIINADVILKRIFELITSVPYTGKVIATQIIIHTNEF